jgi:hypothetical protein
MQEKNLTSVCDIYLNNLPSVTHLRQSSLPPNKLARSGQIFQFELQHMTHDDINNLFLGKVSHTQ